MRLSSAMWKRSTPSSFSWQSSVKIGTSVAEV